MWRNTFFFVLGIVATLAVFWILPSPCAAIVNTVSSVAETATGWVGGTLESAPGWVDGARDLLPGQAE